MSKTYKVIVIGGTNVGKTCLVYRYTEKNYNEQENTIAALFKPQEVSVKGRIVTLGIWDTAGSERYESLTRSYFRGAQAAIICYDITSAESFKKLNFWINELRSIEPKCGVVISGNKLDAIDDPSGNFRREVDPRDVKTFVTGNDIPLANAFETSAKTGKNITELFNRVAEICLASESGSEEPQDKDVVDINQPIANKKHSKCCD